MCGIGGFLQTGSVTVGILMETLSRTSARGRYSMGLIILDRWGEHQIFKRMGPFERNEKELRSWLVTHLPNSIWGIFNFRGQPTTEVASGGGELYIQPFLFGDKVVAHNGIISNDQEIFGGEGSQVSSYLRGRGYEGKIIDSYSILDLAIGKDLSHFPFESLQGSYAMILGDKSGNLLIGRNYRDLAVAKFQGGGLVFASKPEYLPTSGELHFDRCSIPPFNSFLIRKEGGIFFHRELPSPECGDGKKALVVCSGGLDSVTEATLCCERYDEIKVLHFLYGCRAEGRERKAVEDVVSYLQIRFPRKYISLEFIPMGWMKDLGGSTLTDPTQSVAVGDLGVETHHEWVPARNAVLLSIAAAYADRYGYGSIHLGLNMEEAGAYGDNTTEFMERMGEAFDIGTTSRPEVQCSSKNLMKTEIVQLAYAHGAPLHLSWSCYHGGVEECGECGPCRMKYRALELVGLKLVDFASRSLSLLPD